jgi:alkylation response protein AidB-like acyl-CoA dehydrogenase
VTSTDAIAAWWAREGGDLSDPAAAGAALMSAIEAGLLDLPAPGSGATRARWAALVALGRADCTLARLAEAHTDALAILAELGSPPPAAGTRWGVWAAEPPTARVEAAPLDGGWRLDGVKAWCSGATLLSHALVTVHAPDGRRLLAVELDRPGVVPEAPGWAADGMTGSDTRTVRFDDVRLPATAAVGAPGQYLDRPGFWHGAVGVAACWYGGAAGIAGTLAEAAGRRDPGPHALAHLGALDAGLAAARALLDAAADEIDADPLDLGGTGHRTALRVRAVAERLAAEAIDRVGRALGPGPLATDRSHARRVADLQVYVRQHHAERDLAELGRRTAEDPSW